MLTFFDEAGFYSDILFVNSCNQLFIGLWFGASCFRRFSSTSESYFFLKPVFKIAVWAAGVKFDVCMEGGWDDLEAFGCISLEVCVCGGVCVVCAVVFACVCVSPTRW